MDADSEFSVFLKDGGKLGEQMRGTDGRERGYILNSVQISLMMVLISTHL